MAYMEHLRKARESMGDCWISLGAAFRAAADSGDENSVALDELEGEAMRLFAKVHAFESIIRKYKKKAQADAPVARASHSKGPNEGRVSDHGR